jgi:bifunctional ADP-heptose synthase (sugar kinase/adenylyltransferase)
VYDAIVISDYNKGTVDYELITDLIKTVTVPIYIDTKKTDLAQLDGCYIKINKLEHSQATSLPNPDKLIVTYGGDGAVWNGWVFSPDISNDITDVTGAGDTFLAALVYKHLETGNMATAVKFANRASGVTIKHVGVYAPRLEEIE